MSRPIDLLRGEVAEASGYDPDHTPADVVMDANESPYDLPPTVKDAVVKRLRSVDFNRYPDSASRGVREKYAKYAGVKPGDIVAGNGSDELIVNLLTACVEPGDTVLVPAPTFSMYGLLARNQRAALKSVPLDDQWNITDAFVEAAGDAKMVFLGYPNNPTGNCFSSRRIDQVRRRCEGLVVIDEAYFEFAGRSFVDRLAEDEPLVVLRTLSKGFSLAGIRTGFLIAPPAIVDGINTVRLPYNLNRLSQVTAEVVLDHREPILKRNQRLLQQRDRVRQRLRELDLKPYPTDSNFILFRPDDPPRLHEKLLNKGIRVRKFSDPRLESCLRLSVGTPEENDRLLKVLDSLL